MLRGSQPKAKLYDRVTRIHLFLLVPMVTVSLCVAEIDSDPNLVALPTLKVKDLTGQYEGEAVARFSRGASERDQYSARVAGHSESGGVTAANRLG